MTRRSGRAEQTWTDSTGYLGDCRECGKRCYRSKRLAKAAARQAHPDDTMRAYRCADNDAGVYHYGHPAILSGHEPPRLPPSGAGLAQIHQMGAHLRREAPDDHHP